MGDTYFIAKINCAHCGKENNFDDNENEMSLYPGIAYTFEAGGHFTCKFCKKKNDIIQKFETVKARRVKGK